MDQIEDCPSRFSFNYMQSDSAIVVGTITKEQVAQGDIECVTALLFQ